MAELIYILCGFFNCWFFLPRLDKTGIYGRHFMLFDYVIAFFGGILTFAILLIVYTIYLIVNRKKV